MSEVKNSGALNLSLSLSIYIYIYIYISAVKVNALTQIHFNGTNFFNARLTQRVFPVWPWHNRSWRNGDGQCCQLSNIADPFRRSFSLKKAPKPSLWESTRYWPRNARYCSPSARAHTLSSLRLFSAHTLSVSLLSLSLRLICTARGRERKRRFNSVKHRYYVASLILHASIAESQHSYCLYLMCIWFHQTTVRLSWFLCRLTSWKGELVMS